MSCFPMACFRMLLPCALSLATPHLRLVRSMHARVLLLLLPLVLAGCSPALVLNLYNATGETLTITNPPFRQATTVPPYTAVDTDVIGGGTLIRTSQHTWFYPHKASSFPPIPLYQQHATLWRAFGWIDARGRIYLLAPPNRKESPKRIPQPAGFPMEPQKT